MSTLKGINIIIFENNCYYQKTVEYGDIYWC